MSIIKQFVNIYFVNIYLHYTLRILVNVIESSAITNRQALLQFVNIFKLHVGGLTS